MAKTKNRTTFTDDENFRKGASHAAQWILQTFQTLLTEGRSAAEIAAHLKELVGVIADWRSGVTELPDGNPWDWSYKDLASVIKERNEE